MCLTVWYSLSLTVSDCSLSFKMSVSITSSWSQSNGPLRLASVADIDVVELGEISADSCVLLTRGQEEERGELTITGPVRAVLLLTDSPRWEVLANTGYLFSAQGRQGGE